MMDYLAHSGSPGDKSEWQRLADHLLAVAQMAAEFARPFGLEKAAYIAGLFHDLGKYNSAFQRLLEGATMRVDHSTAGAVLLKRSATGMDALMADLVAFAILGHHSGLPDRNTTNPGCFDLRFERFSDQLDPVWRKELPFDLAGLMPDRLLKTTAGIFDLSVVGHFLFSCLVDADFKGTEAFYAKR